MIIWFLLSLAFTQTLVGFGQELPCQPQVITTAPIVIPCRECLQNPWMSAASLLGNPSSCGCGCGCGGGESCPCSIAQESEVETGGEANWCSCCADDSQSIPGGPSFSVGALGSLASIFASIMGGIGNSHGDEAVTVTFDDETCSSDPSEVYPGGPQYEVLPVNNFGINQYPPAPQCEVLPVNNFGNNQYPPAPQCEVLPANNFGNNLYPPGGPQCVLPANNFGNNIYPPGPQSAVLPANNFGNNRSFGYGPPSPVIAPVPSSPSLGTYVPQRFPIPENKYTPKVPQCYGGSKREFSDIEEDSIYAIAGNNPDSKRDLYNPYGNQEAAFNGALTRNRYSQDSGFNQQQCPTFINDVSRQSEQKNNNLIQTPTTGNPEFDMISRLSALLSSQKNNIYAQTRNQEQNIMPCQGCC